VRAGVEIVEERTRAGALPLSGIRDLHGSGPRLRGLQCSARDQDEDPEKGPWGHEQ